MDAAKYAATERLHNGALVQIRATHLIAHLIGIARAAELDEFVAEVLPENMPMLKDFERCGLGLSTRSERGVVHVMLALAQGATEGAK
jgi:hypothetical protein